MNKKTFALLAITFGFFFSLFLAVTFQHPIFISKWVLLLSALTGFGLALLAYLINVKKVQTVKVEAAKLKQLALIALAVSVSYLVLVGYTPNTLLMPSVEVTLTITPASSASTPLTSLVAISESSGTHFFSLKEPEVTYSDTVAHQDRKLVISADPALPASISLQGKAWSDRINFSFESSTRDFTVDFFVNGQKSTDGYTAGQGDGAFITSAALPFAYARHILSFLSFFFSLFVSFFFLGLQADLLREHKLAFLPTLLLILQCLFILVLVLYKLYPYSPHFKSPGIDSYLFNIYGREILRGKMLYQDLWDHKGPLIFTINALGQSLNMGLWGIWLIGLLVPITSGLVLLKVFGKKLGILWPMLLFVFMWAYIRRFQRGNLTEDYGLLFYMLGFFLYWLYLQGKHRALLPFLIGLCAGASLMLRANLISPFIAIGISLLVEGLIEKKVRAAFISIGWIALGFLSVTLVFVGYFAAHGTLFDFLDAAFFYNFLYSQQSGLGFAHKISFVFEYFPLYTTIIIFSSAIVVFSCKTNRGAFSIQENNFLRMIFVGYGIELLLYNMSGNGFIHYMVPLVPYETFILAFFSILLLKSIPGSAFIKTASTLFKPVLLLMLSLGFLGSLYGLNFKTPPSQSDIYQQMQSKLNPGDQLVMWGYSPDYQYILDVPSPSRYYLQLPFTNCTYVTDAIIQEFITDIDTAKPVIVDTKKMNRGYLLDAQARDKQGFCAPLQAFFDYFDKNYMLVDTLTNGMEVYRPVQP